MLRLPEGIDPSAGGYTVRHASSMAAEQGRNLQDASTSGADFAFRAVRRDADTVHGVFLPAPGQATWSVDVPEGARLELIAELLPSHILDGQTSGGASLEVLVDGERLDAVPVSAGDAAVVSVPIPAGPHQLALRTQPGEDAVLDYVFLRHPTLQVSGRAPRRLLLIFVDTLRADHLGVEGYTRDTSPNLDRLATQGTYFRQARSVSPWTLPAARAALSGRMPDEWAGQPSLAGQLSAAGWKTVGLVSNAYLSAKAGMARGFDVYRLDQLAPAERLVAAALQQLEESADQDLAMLVQLMEPHLPYMEPPAQQGRWAGPPPPGLPAVFTRDRLTRIRPGQPQFTALREYVVARYDQNIRSADAALGPLLAAMGPEATVVVFSDHGEEFWDHGGVEHGHTLYDELLRVPLLIRGPGFSAGAVESAPVSLVDIAPTVLSAAGLPIADGPGRALQDGLRDPGALAGRPQAFGHLLYGRDQWAALDGTVKHMRDLEGVVTYDLALDPLEQSPAPGALDPLRELLTAVGLPVVSVWRLGNRARTRGAARAETLTVHHPAGFSAAWGPYDPNSTLSAPTVGEDGSVTVSVSGGQRRPAEIYLIPNHPDAAGFGVSVDGVPLPPRPPGDALWVGGKQHLREDISVRPVSPDWLIDEALERALLELGYLPGGL